MCSYVINGKFYKGKPPTVNAEASTYKLWSHQSQRDNHRKDLIQPYNRDGTANPEFVSEYREVAKEYGMIKGESNE